MASETYSGRSLALVVPTMNRPMKIRALLSSIADQGIACGRIIIVDGGASVCDIVKSFASRLPVEYCTCHPPGQIRQRNLGIKMLDENTPLVGCLDDDIVLLPDALKEMIAFWNRCAPSTAGISFNIVNMPPESHNWIKGLMGWSGPVPGRVLRSGRCTPIVAVKADLQVEWLCGGATVWKLEILNRYISREVLAKWAPAEDLIFSYPIGKQFPLYVCASAEVRHEHVYDLSQKRKYIYYGRTETLWKLFFVKSHKELSKLRYFWLQFTTIVARFLLGIFTLQTRHLQFALGQIAGLWTGIGALIQGHDLFLLLSEASCPSVSRKDQSVK